MTATGVMTPGMPIDARMARSRGPVQPHLAARQQIDSDGCEADGKILDPAVTAELDHASQDTLGADHTGGGLRGIQLSQDAAL